MGICGFLGFPPSLHAIRWERTLLGGLPLLILLVWGVPPLPCWHTVQWERMLPFGGFPPFLGPRPARGGCVQPVPLPLLPARGLRVLLGMGAPLFVLGPAARWDPALLYSGVPPVPPMHAVGARRLVGGTPLLPPLGGLTR